MRSLTTCTVYNYICTYRQGIRIMQRVPVPVVRSHAAVDHTDIGCDLFDFPSGMLLKQDGFILLLCGQHHTVHSLYIKDCQTYQMFIVYFCES
jgi:hypothetical protein